MHPPPQPNLTAMSARLLPTTTPAGGSDVPPGRAQRFRLFVFGPAILHRPVGSSGRWQVAVSADGRLAPLEPPTEHGLRQRLAILERQGFVARLGGAIFVPGDLALVAKDVSRTLRGRRANASLEFYGWSLLYHLPGAPRVGLIDPHDEFPDLPAFYESPLEFIDRQDHLAARGIATRAVALLTQRQDFLAIQTGAGAAPRNRYCPHAAWRRASDLAAFDR